MPGMMYLAAVTVKRGCIQALACTPSLAAAIGTAACIAVRGPSVAAVTRGAWARTLACGACVTNQYITGTETLFVTGKDLSIFR